VVNPQAAAKFPVTVGTVPPCVGLDVQPAMRAIRIRNAILIPPENVRGFMEKTSLVPHTIPEYLWVFSFQPSRQTEEREGRMGTNGLPDPAGSW
jgi:hypothetical protein